MHVNILVFDQSMSLRLTSTTIRSYSPAEHFHLCTCKSTLRESLTASHTSNNNVYPQSPALMTPGRRPHAGHESQTEMWPGKTYKTFVSALVTVAFISIGCLCITQARFLGFATYIIFGGGGASTRDVVISCNIYLDSASPEARLHCVGNALALLVKATASAIVGGYAESAVRESFVRVVAWAHGL